MSDRRTVDTHSHKIGVRRIFMEDPVVSVLIPCFNSAATIHRAIESVISQTYSRWEVVAVDNASADDTFELLAAYSARDPRIRVYRNSSNIGPVANWRECARRARGEYGALLFSDDWYGRDFIRQCLENIGPGIGFVLAHPTICQLDAELECVPRPTTPISRAPTEFGSLFYYESVYLRNGVLPSSPGCMLMRLRDLRRWLDEPIVDRWRSGFTSHGAGPDLWLYLAACRDYPKFAYLPPGLAFFLSHSSNLSRDKRVGQAYSQALLEFWLQNPRLGLPAERVLWTLIRRFKLHQASVLTTQAYLQSLTLSACMPQQSAENTLMQTRQPVTESHLLREFVSKPARTKPLRAGDSAWPSISIIVPSFNQGRFLERTLASIINQRYPNLELIVMDGGSTDESVSILERLSSNISYWVSEPDDGQSHAINKGMANANGEILAYLNSDDLYTPRAPLFHVAEVYRSLGAKTRAVIYSHAYMIDENDRIYDLAVAGDYDPEKYLRGSFLVPQQSSFWTREVFHAVGGFNTANRTCMDGEFYLDAHTHGSTFVCVDAVWSAFRIHRQSISGSGRLDAEHAYQRNELFRARFGRQRNTRDHMLGRFEKALSLPRKRRIRRTFLGA